MNIVDRFRALFSIAPDQAAAIDARDFRRGEPVLLAEGQRIDFAAAALSLAQEERVREIVRETLAGAAEQAGRWRRLENSLAGEADRD